MKETLYFVKDLVVVEFVVEDTDGIYVWDDTGIVMRGDRLFATEKDALLKLAEQLDIAITNSINKTAELETQRRDVAVKLTAKALHNG